MNALWVVYFTFHGFENQYYHQYNNEKMARAGVESVTKSAMSSILDEEVEWYANHNAKVVLEYREIDPDFPEWQDYEPDEVEEFPLFNFPF